MLSITATPALWCVKHRGRIIALVTGDSREAAGQNVAPLLGDHDPDDLRIAEVGIAKPGAAAVVMDLRSPQSQHPPDRTPESKAAEMATRERNKAAKDAPLIEAAAAAWRAACVAVDCAKLRNGAVTFPATDRSPLASAVRLGFWKASRHHGVPDTVAAKATGSSPNAVAQRMRDGLSFGTRTTTATATAMQAAAKVFAARLPRQRA